MTILLNLRRFHLKEPCRHLNVVSWKNMSAHGYKLRSCLDSQTDLGHGMKFASSARDFIINFH